MASEHVDDPRRKIFCHHMLTEHFARDAALEFLANSAFTSTSPMLIDHLTEEYGEGWVFRFQSARFMETGDINDSLIGTAPIFVPRDGAVTCFISYHRPIDESMAAFRSCGDANASANAQVRLFAWKPGALKVSANRAIRDHSQLGLADAKGAVDTCLNGSPVWIDTFSVNDANELVLAMSRLNFLAEVTYGSRPLPETANPAVGSGI